MSLESVEQLIETEVQKRVAELTRDAPAKPNTDGLEYVIVRAYSAGVFAGYLQSHEGNVLELVNSRFCREWNTTNIGDCNDLAADGLAAGKTQSISRTMPRRILVDDFEIIFATEKARRSIEVYGG